jgi:hypothetical protein
MATAPSTLKRPCKPWIVGVHLGWYSSWEGGDEEALLLFLAIKPWRGRIAKSDWNNPLTSCEIRSNLRIWSWIMIIWSHGRTLRSRWSRKTSPSIGTTMVIYGSLDETPCFASYEMSAIWYGQWQHQSWRIRGEKKKSAMKIVKRKKRLHVSKGHLTWRLVSIPFY